jgi:hypothetical protein
VPTFKFIPKKSRDLFSNALIFAIEEVLRKNDLESWLQLLALPKCTLSAIKQHSTTNNNDKKKEREHTLSWRFRRYLEGKWLDLWNSLPPPEPRIIQKLDWRRIVVSKAHSGNLAAAFKALTPDETAPINTNTVAKLTSLHPPASPVLINKQQQQQQQPLQPPQFSQEKVKKAIRSFPLGTAPGPDGLRAQHLLDAISFTARTNPIPALSQLITLLASGKANPVISPYLGGARLISLAKKDGGVRPIAIGCIWRRLTSKLLVNITSQKAKEYFAPHQLGVGTPCGAEAISHAATHLFKTMEKEKDFVFFQADFSNAFNNISRKAFIEIVRSDFPELSPWTDWCYANSSVLFLGSQHKIPSQCGTQQGDPLGPLLFSLVLHKLVKDIAGQIPGLYLNAWYLDDGTIAGPTSLVAKAIEILAQDGPKVGLHLNPKKSVLFWPSSPGIPGHNDNIFDSAIQRTTSEGIIALGCPIGSPKFIQDYLLARIDVNRRPLEKMVILDDPHVSSVLLSKCVSFSRLGYEIRAIHPESTEKSCETFDNQVVSTLEQIAGATFNKLAIEQMQLPVRMGGLGIRSTKKHAPAAYVASFQKTLPLVEKLLPNCPSSPSLDPEATEMLKSQLCNPDQLPDPAPSSQKALGALINKSIMANIMAKANSQDKARILSCGMRGSGAAFNATLNPNLGCKLTKEELKFFVCSRLGLRVCNPGRCQKCQEPLDLLGYHVGTCKYGPNLKMRHNAICEQIYRWCQTAHLNPALEINCTENGTVPADVYIPTWTLGKPAALDVTVVHPLRPISINHASKTQGYSAKEAENKKKRKYEALCSRKGVQFIPLAAEFYGGWSEPAVAFFKTLATRLSHQLEISLSETTQMIFQKLSAIITKKNCYAMLLRNKNLEADNI